MSVVDAEQTVGSGEQSRLPPALNTTVPASVERRIVAKNRVPVRSTKRPRSMTGCCTNEPRHPKL